MTIKYAKSIRKKLRELAGLAHGRELSSAMENVGQTLCSMSPTGGLSLLFL